MINDRLKASVLMMASLFLPLLHNFIPEDLIWAFPFFDAQCECFSWNPSEFRKYPIKAIVPFYFAFGVAPIYIYCRGLVPEMKAIGINLWGFHFIYYTIQAFDIFMAFGQIQYYRTVFIFLGMALHFKWLIEYKRE